MIIERKAAKIFRIDLKEDHLVIRFNNLITKDELLATKKQFEATNLMLDALEATYTMLEIENKLDTLFGKQIDNTIKIATL